MPERRRGHPFSEEFEGEEMNTLTGDSDREDNLDTQSEGGDTAATQSREEEFNPVILLKDHLYELNETLDKLEGNIKLAKKASNAAKLKEHEESLLILLKQVNELSEDSTIQDENDKRQIEELKEKISTLLLKTLIAGPKKGKKTSLSAKSLESLIESTTSQEEPEPASFNRNEGSLGKMSLASTTEITQRFRSATRDQSLVTVKGSNGGLPAMDVMVRGSGFHEKDDDTTDFSLYAYREAPKSKLALMKSKDAFHCEFPPAMQLTVAEQKNLRSEGLKVFSPTGQVISFRLSKTTFEAILKKEETAVGENEEVARLKNALSLITMINNVREKCKEVHVETSDPFLAQIANGYIAYLTEQGISMGNSTVSVLTASSELQKEAKDIFETHFLSAFQTFTEESPYTHCLEAIKAEGTQIPRLSY